MPNPTRRQSLSRAQARRLAIAAQGLAIPAGQLSPSTQVRQMRRCVKRLGLLQIDSVNVIVRAHYMPLFSRLGAYDRGQLDSEAYKGKTRSLFEYWGHECSLIPVNMQPLFRWRMAAAARGEGVYRELATFGREQKTFIAGILKEIETGGAKTASDLSCGNKGEGGWWGWSDGKHALEWLFWAGRITTKQRLTNGFARLYDLPERVLPSAIVNTPTPSRDEAQRQLLIHAITAMGVATETDLRDYFRMPTKDTKLRIAELVEAGELCPVEVKDWRQEAYLAPNARIPRKAEGCALLAPFDPLVWERSRTERLFDFQYRLEIYTPAHKRQYGYYVMPFLDGDRLAARVCLKADRQGDCLRVNSAHGENGIETNAVAERLLGQLRHMANWLGLSDIAIAKRGDLAPALRDIHGRR